MLPRSIQTAVAQGSRSAAAAAAVKASSSVHVPFPSSTQQQQRRLSLFSHLPRSPISSLIKRHASTPATPPAPSAHPPSLARPPQKHKKAKTKAKAKATHLPKSLDRSELEAAEAVATHNTSSSSSSSALPDLGSTTAGLRGHRGIPDKLVLPPYEFASQPRARPHSDGKAIALTTAESYDFPELLRGLDALGLWEGAINLEGEAIYLREWVPSQGPAGEVFIFESGAVITWGLDLNGAQEFVRTVLRGGGQRHGQEVALGWVERGRYEEWEVEVLEYKIAPDAPSAKMNGDMIILPSGPSASITPTSSTTSPESPRKDLLSRLAFSAGMARVTKLGVYEEQFDKFALGTAGIPALLENGDKSPVKKKDIVMRFGTLLGFRQKLNLDDENLLDEPEFLWEDEGLHHQYESICKALEFDSRLEVLNQRVDYAFQLQDTLMDLLNADVSHKLEWIIIILIAFEIGITLYKEAREVWREKARQRETARLLTIAAATEAPEQGTVAVN